MNSELRDRIFNAAPAILLGSSLMFGLELGLFDALARQQYSAVQLAAHLQLDQRYTEEWLLHMRANNMVTQEDGQY
jgi:hypothetical protein